MLSVNFAATAKANQKSILITEVQTGTEVSASQEFVEIYNDSSTQVDISGWSMYYKSATGNTWTKKATILTRILNPGEFFVFNSGLLGDISFSSTFSESGGNIQIRNNLGVAVDQFAWGSGNSALGKSASESSAGQSMYRIFDFENKKMQNTDNNFEDFEITQSPTPSELPEVILPEAETETINYPGLELSELFPDPTDSQSDSNDEFIEIFNPNNQDVDLTGWKLKDESGTEYIIKNNFIPANERLAIFVIDSKLTLNNTGDSVQLINPNGEVVDESTNYGDAIEGLGWIKINGVWNWAESATPNLPNSAIYIEPQSSPSQAVKNVKKASKKAAVKKSSSSKPKTSKVKASSSKNNASAPIQESSKSKNPNLWTWLLVAAGVATISYGIYEYRTEIQLQLNKLRSKFGTRQ